MKAVEAAGGQIAVEAAVKPRELPQWLQASAPRSSGSSSTRRRARALVGAGRRAPAAPAARAREARARARPGRAHRRRGGARARAPASAERKVWTLADALVAGDRRTATRALLELRRRASGCRACCTGWSAALRDALAIAEALAAGQPAAQVKSGLRMPGFAADRLISDVAKRDVDSFRRALELLADLELESRGGGRRRAQRGDRGGPRGHRGHGLRAHATADGPSGAVVPRTTRSPRRGRASNGPLRAAGGGFEGARPACCGAGGRRGTSCGRRCCGAARRA